MQGPLSSGQLAPVARDQLAAWQDIAQARGVHLDGRVWRCSCGKGVYLDTDELGRTYVYTPEEKMAAMVLHLRNHHTDLNPDLPC